VFRHLLNFSNYLFGPAWNLVWCIEDSERHEFSREMIFVHHFEDTSMFNHFGNPHSTQRMAQPLMSWRDFGLALVGKRRWTLMFPSIGLVLLLALASPAPADIIYDASASFAFGGYTLGGQLTVDTTTGIVTSSSLTVTRHNSTLPAIPNGFFN
jgi:hypothetical protein